MNATALLRLNRLSPERQLTALDLMDAAAAAGELHLEPLRAAIMRQRARATRLRELQARWDQQQGAGLTRAVDAALADPEGSLRVADAEVDAAVGRLHRKLVADATAYEASEPEGAAARRLLVAAFPIGLFDHVNAPLAEQRSHNAALAALLRSEVWAADLAAAHLGSIVRVLLSATDTFELRYAASRSEPAALSWADVKQAAAEAHEGLCRLVAAVLVAAEDDATLEERLLRPVLAEQEATRRPGRRAGAAPDDGEAAG